MSFCLNNKKRLALEHYLHIAYIVFICDFFILPVRGLRDFYYLFVFLPFLALVYQKKNVFLFRSNVFWALITYLFFMCLTLFWADGAGFKESFNYVRKAFLTLSFVCVTVYLLHKDRNFLQSIFKWSCLVSGIMAIFWIILFYFVEGNVGRIGSIGWRSAPIQAGNVYALMAVITCLLFCFRSKFLSRKFILYCCVGLSLLVFVVLTGSRGPILSFLAVLFFCSIILDFKKNIVITCCFTLLVWIAFFFKVFDLSSLLERGSSYRPTIWRQSIDFLLEKPIFGYGHAGARPNIVFGDNIISEHSHNVFLSNALDGGLLSVLLVVVVLLLSGYWTFSYFKKQHNIVPFALVLFAIFSNFTDGRTLVMSPGYQWLCFWLPVSIAIALELKQKFGDEEGMSCNGDLNILK